MMAILPATTTPSLNAAHGKGAISCAPRASGQRPRSRDGVPRHGSGEGEVIAPWRSGQYVHSKLAGHVTVEIAAQCKRSTFGFSGNEARRAGVKSKVADAQASIGRFYDGSLEGEGLRIVRVHQSGGPVPVDVAAVLAARATADQCHAQYKQAG